jgi:hypothetical protein
MALLMPLAPAMAAMPNGSNWFRHGEWGRDTKDMSSNYRELWNLVEALEEEVSSNMLSDAELFIFMDNTTAEGA